VVFLNQESDDSNEDGYSGGSLTFYGLMEGAENSSIGFRLIGEEGLLVAFPSSIVHEVTPVTRGARYTIASWYF
jgi:predicted 2-oxoglutarate/Fe(II)-dependent dioxygenase YbiX